MFSNSTLAGIIRISPELAPAGKRRPARHADRTLAELFAAWGDAGQSIGARPPRLENRLTGTLAGPRQHKLRADLTQIQEELELELASFMNKAQRD